MEQEGLQRNRKKTEPDGLLEKARLSSDCTILRKCAYFLVSPPLLCITIILILLVSGREGEVQSGKGGAPPSVSYNFLVT